MQRLLNFFVAVSAGLGLAAATAWAQPASDYFNNATVITGIPGSTNGTTIGATNREAGDPFTCGWSSPFGATVWYAWTSPTNGPVTFVVQTTNMDATIGIYTGTSITNLAQVACYGSISISTNISVTFNATNGVVYKVEVAGNSVQVSGFVGAGNFNLSWSAGGGQGQLGANDNFANAQVLIGPAGSVTGANTGATHE